MTVGPGTASLQGAVFALEYYATTDPLHDNMPPVRTWYYQTDNNGQIYSTGEAYLVPELTESDGSVLWSDELYREKNGCKDRIRRGAASAVFRSISRIICNGEKNPWGDFDTESVCPCL